MRPQGAERPEATLTSEDHYLRIASLQDTISTTWSNADHWLVVFTIKRRYCIGILSPQNSNED